MYPTPPNTPNTPNTHNNPTGVNATWDPSGALTDRPAILTVGFGTAAAMWAIWYVTHLAIVAAPPQITFFILLSVQILGGFVLGYRTKLGPLAAILTAAITGLINMMILGSVLGDPESQSFLPPAWQWLISFFTSAIVLQMIGFGVGRLVRRKTQAEAKPIVNWSAWFAFITLATTFLLLIAGGLVTGNEAGLAVPDWPGTFGANMFAYSLTMMTSHRPVYYEHAHRLLGALVGLTTVALAIHMWFAEPRHRRWLKWLATAAVVVVIIQGVMGGLRVTLAVPGEQGAAVAEAYHETTVSLMLRIAHGVLAQIFLGMLVIMAIALSWTWQKAASMQRAEAQTTADEPIMLGSPIDRRIGIVALVLLVVQLMLGAILRHTHNIATAQDPDTSPIGSSSIYINALILHIALAMVVLGLLVFLGLRVRKLWQWPAQARTMAGFLLIGIATQFVLGFIALWATWTTLIAMNISGLITTIHQAIGAALLALAVGIVVWARQCVITIATPALPSMPAPRATSPANPDTVTA